MDRPHLLLKAHNYFKGLPDDIIDDLANHIRVEKYEAGDIVHDINDLWEDILFIVEGRIKAVTVDGNGTELLFGVAGRGDQMGMIMSALAEPMPARAIALEPSTVLSIDQEQAFEISAKHRELRQLWRRKLAGNLAKKHS